MATESMIAQVRKGMMVKTADGVNLGKVAMVWLGSDPSAGSPRCDEAVCSRLEVRRGFFAQHVHYIPYTALGDIAGKTVTLSVDQSIVEEKGWQTKPQWIPTRKGHWDDVDHTGGSIGSAGVS